MGSIQIRGLQIRCSPPTFDSIPGFCIHGFNKWLNHQLGRLSCRVLNPDRNLVEVKTKTFYKFYRPSALRPTPVQAKLVAWVPVARSQGCGIEGFLPTSVIQGNPPYEQNSLWEALSVVSQTWIPFPTAPPGLVRGFVRYGAYLRHQLPGDGEDPGGPGEWAALHLGRSGPGRRGLGSVLGALGSCVFLWGRYFSFAGWKGKPKGTPKSHLRLTLNKSKATLILQPPSLGYWRIVAY